jgi:hypothetical protein
MPRIVEVVWRSSWRWWCHLQALLLSPLRLKLTFSVKRRNRIFTKSSKRSIRKKSTLSKSTQTFRSLFRRSMMMRIVFKNIHSGLDILRKKVRFTHSFFRKVRVPFPTQKRISWKISESDSILWTPWLINCWSRAKNQLWLLVNKTWNFKKKSNK